MDCLELLVTDYLAAIVGHLELINEPTAVRGCHARGEKGRRGMEGEGKEGEVKGKGKGVRGLGSSVEGGPLSGGP